MRKATRTFFVWFATPLGTSREREIERGYQLHKQADMLEGQMQKFEPDSEVYRELGRRSSELRRTAVALGNRHRVPGLIAAAY